MFTPGYCFKFLLLLVLQVSVCLYADEVTEKQQPISTPGPGPDATTTLPTTYSPAPQEFPQKPVNGVQIISSNTTLNRPNLTNTNSSDVNLNDTQSANTEKEEVHALISNSGEGTYGNTWNPQLHSLEEALHNLSKTSVNGYESKDLLSFPSVNTVDLTNFPDVPLNFTSNETVLNTDTELIEDGPENTEDVLRNPSLAKESSRGPGVPLVQGQLAAILAAVFVSISIIGYVGLLSWRRFLEKRYGSRELIIDQDELYNVEDLRHFTI